MRTKSPDKLEPVTNVLLVMAGVIETVSTWLVAFQYVSKSVISSGLPWNGLMIWASKVTCPIARSRGSNNGRQQLPVLLSSRARNVVGSATVLAMTFAPYA